MKATGVCSRSVAPIRIINPEPGGKCFTSLSQAAKYVAGGVAEWIGEAIRFKRENERHLAAVNSARNYDRIGRRMTNKELRRIPFAGKVERVFYK